MPAGFHKEQDKWSCNSYSEDHKDGHHIVQLDWHLLPVVAVRGEPQLEGELPVFSPDNSSVSHLLQPAKPQVVLTMLLPVARPIDCWLIRSAMEWFVQRKLVLKVNTLRHGGHFMYNEV